jgi:catechol 2,3-dioxygenase-like lactoylglutathione lyase family enzyme
MTANIRLGSVSLDCADPHALADFWATLLGGEVAYRSDTFVAVQLDALWLTAITVENYAPPTWPSDDSPKQIHLDLAVKDLGAAAQEALALGAKRCEAQPSPDSYLVFLDPAGHPFCLTTQIPD